MDSREKKLLLKHKISSIWGWLELGDLSSAEEEASDLQFDELSQPESIDIFYEISRKKESWKDCVHYGEELTRVSPADPGTWVRLCNALFWSGQAGMARDLATQKIKEFPEEWDLVYNLACYLTKLKSFDAAIDALQKAARISPNKEYFEAQAVLDSDLKPLWDHLGMSGTQFFKSSDIV